MKTWSEVDRVEDDGCHETPVDTGERQEETEINGGGRGAVQSAEVGGGEEQCED